MKTSILLVIAMMLGCISGTGNETACDTQSLTWSLPSVAGSGSYTLPALTSPPITMDFSTTLNKISKVTKTLDATISSMTINNANGEFDWVPSITVDIEGTSSATPRTTLAVYARSGNASSMDMAVLMDGTALLPYLESGPVSLTITLASGTVNQAVASKLGGQLTTSVSTCIAVSGSISKSL
jgi:hypothetical protein